MLQGLINDNVEMFFLFTIALFVLSLFLVILLWFNLRGIQKRHKKMLGGVNPDNLESLLMDVQEQLQQMKDKNQAYEKAIRSIGEKMKKMKANVELIRYNAFAQSGSDLSFSVAILDDDRDGVVLSGIHNREQTFLYAKPLVKGKSQYTLSPEEEQVINQAASKQAN
jgi:hypothetical protein